MKNTFCADCKFFKPFEAEDDTGGWCRRKPPVIVDALFQPAHPDTSAVDAVAGCSFFPAVDQDDWCGEFQPS
jgi:hypothetical protein